MEEQRKEGEERHDRIEKKRIRLQCLLILWKDTVPFFGL